MLQRLFLYAFALVVVAEMSLALTQPSSKGHRCKASRPTSRHTCSNQFDTITTTASDRNTHYRRNFVLASSQTENDEERKEDAKFGFGQRIESIKTAAVGAVSGGFALAPTAAVHDLLLAHQGLAQWEFDTDTGALEAALFAIVYRYCIREDANPQLNDGVVGAFVLTRTLTRIKTPVYCTAAPLDCGAPIGYLDWSMLWELAVNGAESAILFGATAAAMEYCFKKNYIGKFPG